MNSRSVFLLFMITSCSTATTVWETVGGDTVSEELLIAAKEVCDYDKKYAEMKGYELEHRRLFGRADYFSGQLNDALELRAIDLNNKIGELNNELSECMRQQDLVQMTAASNI